MAVAHTDIVGRLIGTPFVAGGRDPSTGLDCWGMLVEVYRDLGWTAPDPFAYDRDEDLSGVAFALWDDFEAAWEQIDTPSQPGDVLVTPGNSHPKGHVAVYLDPKRVLNIRRDHRVMCLPYARIQGMVTEVMRMRPERKESGAA